MKLLITGAFSCTPEQKNILTHMGNELLFMQNEKGELPQGAEEAEGIICNGLFLYHDISKFSKLKYIQLTSAGLDRVPLDYIKERNITINNARGVYSIPMAEFAVGGVLDIYKQRAFFEKNKAQHMWEKRYDLCELYKKIICIVGCGNIGDECAKRFDAFGCSVFGIDVNTQTKNYYKSISPLCNLKNILSVSDIVILTLPLTEETKHLFCADIFSAMKTDSIFVNISRGAIVDTQALIDALNTKLLGAVLDVFEEEPLDPDNPLWDIQNAIITPHNSFVGENNSNRLWAVIKNNLEQNI